MKKSLVTEETEKTIDARIKAINEAQRLAEAKKIIETAIYTQTEEYKRDSRRTPTPITNHPKFKNRR